MRDLHTHTIYSDGNNTPEEMLLSAIEKGLTEIGISDHSYTFFDTSYCMKENRQKEYKDEISALKKKYEGKISVLCGIEYDGFSTAILDGYDYVIGSVHYISPRKDVYIPVDEDVTTLEKAAKTYFDGDTVSLAVLYFETVAQTAKRIKPDIIGHFDLISKFAEQSSLFDLNDRRYISAWQKAIDTLLPLSVPFEINTGAISRGYRTSPYPSGQIREYIASKGGSFVLSSDAHSKETIAFKFGEFC